MSEIREVVGNTTATPNPQPDWNQTDSTKADFIKNKPNKEVQNITSIDAVYDTVDDLPTDKGNGTTLLVLSEKSLYSYNSTAKAWQFKAELKPHTLYCVLEDEKAGLYRFTMKLDENTPYLVSVESHTLQEAKDYVDMRIAELLKQLGAS